MTLDAVIERKLSLIVETFVSDVRVHQLVPGHRSGAEIGNQIESLLGAIVYALRRGHAKDPDAIRLGHFHGEQRARLSGELRGLLLEFDILRSTIVDIASRYDVITAAEVERLAQILHITMVESVMAYCGQTSPVITAQSSKKLLHTVRDSASNRPPPRRK